MPRASYYRAVNNTEPKEKLLPLQKRRSARALTVEERQAVLDVLHSKRFQDMVPAEVYATLLDEKIYLCSISTMYRILHSQNEVRERRSVACRKNAPKPVLFAEAPNQVWSWDITDLRGPERERYKLYVIIDIFSRYVVGWMIARHESAELASVLIAETVEKEEADPHKLTIHSDRGPSMTSQLVANLLSDLGVTKSLNRAYVSNDNPYSESHFRTLKDQPIFPSRFGSLADAKAFCRVFFNWYNETHYHSGIALMTPSVVHHGQAEQRNQDRKKVLELAYQAHPERFVDGCSKGLVLPVAAWINQPKEPDPDKGLLATTGNGTIIGTVR
jgi:putative transposase